MRESATVVALEPDCVWVETRRQGSCQACSANKGCGQGLMSRLLPGREHYVRALTGAVDRENLAIGDIVEIDVPDEVILQASAVVYLVPLLSLIAGMLVGAWLVPGDPGAIAGGILGLLFGAALVRWHAHHVRNDSRVQPHIVSGRDAQQAVRFESPRVQSLP